MMKPVRPRAHASKNAAARFRSLSLLLTGGATLVFALVAPPARADEVSAENKAAARDLATEGIKLAQDGNCEEAIPKLSRAERLYHAPTIVTWIGQCQIEIGRYVEGTETLNRVVRENIPEDAPDAFKAAQTKARELIAQAQPKIGKLTIEVTPADVEGLEVRVDDRPISAAMVGAPKPTDPGTHTVTVTAPSYKPVSREVEMEEGGQETLNVELEIDREPSATPVVAEPPEKDVAKPQEAKSSSNWIGFATVGLGAALMAGGGVTGYLAMSKKNDLSCADDGSCPPSEEDTLNAARTSATVSTILFGVGGAVAVTGVVLLITGKRGPSETARGSYLEPTVGLSSLGLRGAF